ncbi:MAG: NPCBM/NEW2 domain-containing protein [Chthoniobacter sp.]|nr:NPCBM/NEW2 domain-containing protein [Chthoniobacter sp.]
MSFAALKFFDWSQGVAFLVCLVIVRTAHAASIETFDGTKTTGTLTMDAGQFLITPGGGAAVKVDPADVLRAQFADALPVENFSPGVVLRNGTRLTGPFTALTDPVVKFDRYKLALPGGEIAWVVYQPFLPTVAATAPPGKVGALLAGGDFFEGTIKAADDKSAKVLNPIFGPRTLVGGNKDLLALILRDARRSAALFEVRTKDGALFGADALGLDKTGVTLRHPLYDNVKIETKDLLEIRAGAVRYQPLTALKLARVDPLPGRRVEQCFAVDKTIAGDALDSLGATRGKGFESAFGVAATWEVPAGFTILNVLVAVPSGVPPATRVTFAVYADGRPITRSSPLAAGDKPAPLRANFGVVRSISLRVEPASPANATGTGLWLDPVLTHR